MLAVVQVVLLILNILWWIIIVSAILSWLLAFNILDYRNNFVRTVSDTLYRMTEPLYRPIRRILPNLGGLDLSPLVVLIAIFFIQQLIYLYVVPAIYRAGI
ncbi:YggT family protein [Aureimonas ureilytica]|uniref:YggT family protein n=1 Tax=Aureimonas ureilytica TaxID=401562 RepID=UPI000360B9B6|nr:YggT family protein [Aureimonas ureilytica]